MIFTAKNTPRNCGSSYAKNGEENRRDDTGEVLKWECSIYSKASPQRKSVAGHITGQTPGRLFADFISSSRSADSEIRPSLRILRDRCREISRNHPYAQRYLQIMATNVVGDTGVQMQVRKRNDDGSLDTVGNRIVERAFAAWGRPGFLHGRQANYHGYRHSACLSKRWPVTVKC